MLREIIKEISESDAEFCVSLINIRIIFLS